MKYGMYLVMGFSHVTGYIAQIEKKLESNKTYKCIIICGESQINFTKLYLKEFLDRIVLREILTDIGLINKINSLEVDKEKLEYKLKKLIKSWNILIKEEINFLKNYKISNIFVIYLQLEF
ncbi:hypothetical protein MKD34_00855 [Cetobacterium somerae]|uniref:hypothetical protein n=1 Tax=Cetobacterium somerae TaxID=188913 RepID=UPI001F05B153|nr:hypothetical protein [Cetobacterium somerae]UPO97417.1 hypothetical protein MKD34_00855 [Cetobacterium somerae]